VISVDAFHQNIFHCWEALIISRPFYGSTNLALDCCLIAAGFTNVTQVATISCCIQPEVDNTAFTASLTSLYDGIEICSKANTVGNYCQRTIGLSGHYVNLSYSLYLAVIFISDRAYLGSHIP